MAEGEIDCPPVQTTSWSRQCRKVFSSSPQPDLPRKIRRLTRSHPMPEREGKEGGARIASSSPSLESATMHASGTWNSNATRLTAME